MSDHTFLLQDWTTVRGNLAAASPLVQSQEGWLDVSGFADAAYWIDVAEVTPPSAGNYVQLFLETAPTCDDIANPSPITQSWFQPTTGAIRLGTAAPFIQASSTPLVFNSVRTPSTVSLSRYLRWRIVPSANGAWDLTFRIRAVGNRSGFFAPTDISGCVLWLRSDAGVTPGSGASVSTWADLSGRGNNASAGSTAPSYNAFGGVSNFPRVTGATNAYMTGSFSGSGNVQAHTLFCVVSYPSGPTNAAAFAGTISSAVNSGFAQFTETSTGIIGRAGASPSLFASTVTTNASSLGNVGIYSTAADSNATVDLYVNGAPVTPSASTSFTLASVSDYVLFDLCVPVSAYNFHGDAYEHILFNRVLTAAERTRVHRYLGGRYGIAVP